MTIRQFADLIKMNSSSLSNCRKKGSVPSHIAVIAALMGEMAEHKIDLQAVIAQIDIEPKRPRGAGIGKFGGHKSMASSPCIRRETA